MLISILTLFPEMFTGPLDFSIVARAREKTLVTLNLVNIRDFATDKYQTVDDRPYGGGKGMILKVDVLDRALEKLKAKNLNLKTKNKRVILLDPKGSRYTQAKAKHLSTYDHLILVCGHYEGVDARVSQLVDEAISIGDFILTGGELPALVLIDSIVRLLPGVLPDGATVNESFAHDSLEAPQYTRPQVYKKMQVPQVLLSGHHHKIDQWRKKHAPKLLK